MVGVLWVTIFGVLAAVCLLVVYSEWSIGKVRDCIRGS